MRSLTRFTVHYKSYGIILFLVHTYRNSNQTSPIDLQTIPTHPTHSEPKCSTDKPVKTIEQCETDSIYDDTTAETEKIYLNVTF